MSRRKKHRGERFEMETGEKFSITRSVKFTCPFCSGDVTVGDKNGSGQAVVMHSVEPCAKYIDEDPLVFLRNARVKMHGPLPDDDEWPVQSLPKSGTKAN